MKNEPKEENADTAAPLFDGAMDYNVGMASQRAGGHNTTHSHT